MSRYLAASIGLADGRIIRVGPDEDQVGDIPLSFSFQTQIPGGFSSASLVIARPPNLYQDDSKLFSDVVVYGDGMQIVYEGYVTGIPQQSQDQIQIQMAGWSSVLDRIANFRQIFVDRDLTRWKAPSSTRILKMFEESSTSRILEGPTIGVDDNSKPVLSLAGTGQGRLVNEAWFDAGPGLTVSRVFFSQFNLEAISQVTISGYIGFSDSDVDSGHPINQDSGSFNGKSWRDDDGQLPNNTIVVANKPTRYAWIRVISPFINASDTGKNWLSNPTVYGTHNLTPAGPQPKGIYGSDAISYMVGATPLNLLPESIEASDFVLPHLSFVSDISIREAIEQINVFGGIQRYPNDWGVYDNREFFWRSPGSYGKTWIVKSENLSSARSDGPDSTLRTSGVKVNYQDETNTPKSVGPPNSFSDFETRRLLSDNEDNPAFRIPSFYTQTVGTTTRSGALNIGQVLLNERNRLNWRGDLELQGEVMDSEGKVYPVHRMRAGDHVIVEDDNDKRPRPINSTTYSHDNLSLTASLGAVPDTLDSLLARLAAVTDLTV